MTVAFQQRKRWRNHTGNQSIEPLRIYRPATLEDVCEIVTSAERDGATVRAVGSGHSWSDVALTTGYLLRPERLNRPLEINGNLVRVEAGMRLRERWADWNRTPFSGESASHVSVWEKTEPG